MNEIVSLPTNLMEMMVGISAHNVFESGIRNMELIRDCPHCGKEKHLYVNTEKKVYHCHRCKASGKVKGDDLQRIRRVAPRPIRKLAEGEGAPAPEAFPLSNHSKHYLTTKRHINKGFLESFPIYDTDTGILFQFNGTGYWQVRQWKQFSPPRWLNPKNTPKDIYYSVEQVFLPTVFIVEGILDALAVGEYGPSAGILGSLIKDEQAYKLAQKYENCVLMLDGTPDVTEKLIQRNLRKLRSCFEGRVGVERLKNGLDPATVPKDRLRTIVSSWT